VARLRAESEEHKSTITHVSQELMQKKQEIDQLHRQRRHAEAISTQIGEASLQKSRTIEELKEHLQNAVEEHRVGARPFIVNTQNEVAKNEASIKALRDENAAVKQENDRLKERVTELTRQVGRILCV